MRGGVGGMHLCANLQVGVCVGGCPCVGWDVCAVDQSSRSGCASKAIAFFAHVTIAGARQRRYSIRSTV